MIEILLSLIILALLAFVYFTNRSFSKEREKLLKMIMAKNLDEVTANEVVDTFQSKEDNGMIIPPDKTEINSDDESVFDKHIAQILEDGKKEAKEVDG